MSTLPALHTHTDFAHFGKLANLNLKPTGDIQITQFPQIERIKPLDFDAEINLDAVVQENMKHEHIVLTVHYPMQTRILHLREIGQVYDLGQLEEILAPQHCGFAPD